MVYPVLDDHVLDDQEEVHLRATRPDLRAIVREFVATGLEPGVTLATLRVALSKPEAPTALIILFVRHYSHRDPTGVTYTTVDDVVGETREKVYTEDVLDGCEDWNVLCMDKAFKRIPDMLNSFRVVLFVVNNTHTYREELMAKAWHPSRMVDWCLDTEEAAVFRNKSLEVV